VFKYTSDTKLIRQKTEAEMNAGDEELWAFGNADEDSDSSYQPGESLKSDSSDEFSPIPGSAKNWSKKMQRLMMDATRPIRSADEVYGDWGLIVTDSPGISHDSDSTEELMPWEDEEDEYENESESSEEGPTVERELTPESDGVRKVYKSRLASDVVYGTILPGLVQQTGQAAEYDAAEIVFKRREARLKAAKQNESVDPEFEDEDEDEEEVVEDPEVEDAEEEDAEEDTEEPTAASAADDEDDEDDEGDEEMEEMSD
jgi:hypothetical protein